MANTFDIGLKSKLKTFAEKFSIDTNNINEKDWFELFSNYVVVSTIINEDLDDPNSISTGKSKGIDGISIIVNNRIIKEESDLEKIGEKEKLIVRLCFIQATTLSSFSLQKFQSFTDEVINFLNGVNNIEPFSDVLKKLFDEEGRYYEQISETPSIDLFFCSGKTNHQIQNSELETEKKKILSRNDFEFQFNLNDIHILQTDDLKGYYEKIAAAGCSSSSTKLPASPPTTASNGCWPSAVTGAAGCCAPSKTKIKSRRCLPAGPPCRTTPTTCCPSFQA